jgi:hypothetical protein
MRFGEAFRDDFDENLKRGQKRNEYMREKERLLLERRIDKAKYRQTLAENKHTLREMRARNRIQRRTRKVSEKIDKLVDIASAKLSLYRTYRVASVMLIITALAGIVWTSKGVHDGLVGVDGPVLYYFVEPLFSAPLIANMIIRAQAARLPEIKERAKKEKTNKEKLSSALKKALLVAMEATLVMIVIAINTLPVLPGWGTWQGPLSLIIHLAQPMVIVISVAFQPILASFVARRLTGQPMPGEDSVPSAIPVVPMETPAAERPSLDQYFQDLTKENPKPEASKVSPVEPIAEQKKTLVVSSPAEATPPRPRKSRVLITVPQPKTPEVSTEKTVIMEPIKNPNASTYPSTPRALKAAAEAEALRALAAGQPHTGKTLAEEFGMSDRWGRSILKNIEVTSQPPIKELTKVG